jgi:predicted DNA-binding transcriptional regulator YafY
MKELFSTYERRMEILTILLNQKIVSRLELARLFSVSNDAINRDVIALSRYAPLCSKRGRYGGIYILDEYNAKKAYLSRDEEYLLEKLLQYLTGKDYILLKNVLYKFSMPK